MAVFIGGSRGAGEQRAALGAGRARGPTARRRVAGRPPPGDAELRGGLRLGTSRPDEPDGLPRLSLRRSTTTASAVSTACASPASRWHGAPDGQAGRPLLGGVHGPAGTEEGRSRSPARVLAGNGVCTGPAPTPMLHPPARTSRTTTSTTSSASARTPWNSSPAVRSKPSTAGTVALSSRSALGDPVGGAPTGPLVDSQHVRHRASLTAFISECKAQSLSMTSAGNPRWRPAPSRVTVIRSNDFPAASWPRGTPPSRGAPR